MSTICERLTYLYDNNQFAFTPVRRVIQDLNDDNVDQFWADLNERDDVQEIVNDMARMGLCPLLLNGEEHPLTLTEAGNEYKYPERANAFLELMAQGPNTIAEDAEMLALEEATRPDNAV